MSRKKAAPLPASVERPGFTDYELGHGVHAKGRNYGEMTGKKLEQAVDALLADREKVWAERGQREFASREEKLAWLREGMEYMKANGK